MDELIFQFLLQAGFPRAAIVADAALLTPGGTGAIPDEATTYVVVDPDTAERLAAIEVVEAIDGDALQSVATDVGRYARRLGGREMQGFVIRVDPRGRNDAEQVQFFRVWPNPMPQQLSAKTFPDLDGLRVALRLTRSSAAGAESEIIDVVDEEEPAASADVAAATGAGPVRRYVPPILLALLAIADWYLVQTRGVALLSATQGLLAVGAAALLSLSR